MQNHDASIYNIIFGEEFPNVKFLAGGNATDVAFQASEFEADDEIFDLGRAKNRKDANRESHAQFLHFRALARKPLRTPLVGKRGNPFP